jgi:Tfp pilus assembly protein PilO
MNLRERFMLVGAVILLGLVVFKFLVYDPYQAQHSALVAARDAAKAELDRNNQIIARGAQIRAEYQRVRTSVIELEKKLPTSKEVPPLLTAMEDLTRKLGIGFDSIHPGTPAPVVENTAKQGQASAPGAQTGSKAIPYSRMEVDLSITGTFAQTLAYLRDLRDFPRLIVVNSVSMNPQVQSSKLGVSLLSEVYILDTPKEQE